MKLIAVGDVHGCNNELIKLLEVLQEKNYVGEDFTYIFLGDYVDRGPDSKGVVNTLIDLKKKQNCIFIRGNHEDLMMMYFDQIDYGSWERNGGKDTLKSYGMTGFATHSMLPSQHKKFYASLYNSFETDGLFFCHAGIMPGVPFDEQRSEDLRWIRKSFLYSEADHGKLVVHGHTVESTTDPVIKSNRINLDTGCVFGGHLTAAYFDENKLVEIVQVKSEFDWLDRDLNLKVKFK